MTWQLLLVEDEASIREAFALRLTGQGYAVETAGSGEECLTLLKTFEPDILVLDLVMPNLSGLDVLERVKQTSPHLLVILLTARGTVKDAVEATRLGAFDFVAKSIDMEDLHYALRRAVEFLTLQRQVRLHTGQDTERYAFARVLAESPVTQAFLAQVRELAKNDRVTVLLQGETGTGKQYTGRVIHFNGARVDKPCIEVDCPSIPRELFESELFGHERGSFTGAVGRKTGLIEMADGGTVLFDEIGDLPLPLQAKLLRVIEERTFRRVGGSTTIPVDVRFMAATNRNLKDAVAKGEFREDLYFRLNVVALTVPPLRERQEDIIPLAERFLTRSALSLRKPVRHLGDSAQALLRQYNFPGNVRELSNLIERAVLFCPGDTLESAHFPSDVQSYPSQPAADTAHPASTSTSALDPSQIHLSFHLGESLASLDDRIINEVLKRADGNKSLAAKHLGITRWMLDRRRKP
ncbi:MAG: sigma-54-dependent Fis family transcriptional regulator [Nitrospira sp.]|nr:sigma-54-dependent Fis family transcriptional regulator [Nitrospira sp.]MBH0183467.1 sigma-54-dependent Fis family transcriptional regulator [Nitrospira sp.]MBH0186831.1 sigma-54-dependent Fis family transcriptional regulator [Nitrospira sp.]